MSKLFGREIGSARRNPWFDSIAWFDLTAGDGVPIDNEHWHKGCSPGILAHHARFQGAGGRPLPVTVHLYERAANTYATLVGNLAEQLPTLGYERVDGTTWRCGPATLTAHLAPAHTAAVDHIGPATAVMMANDPNNVDQWACPSDLLDEVCRRTQYALMLSTMGCNAAGLKRLDRGERDLWFAHVESQVAAKSKWHDCYLAAIERDASQWAYLITAPEKWRAAVEEDAVKAFSKHGFGLDTAWTGPGRLAFDGIRDRLFLTSQEREPVGGGLW